MIKKIDELIRLVSKAWRVLNTNNRTSYKLTFKHFQNDAVTKLEKILDCCRLKYIFYYKTRTL